MDDERFQSRVAFLFGEPEAFFDDFAQLESPDGPLRPSLLAFRANLSSAIRVGNVPYQLTHSSVLDQRFNQILTAERIRTLKIVPPGASLDAELEKKAFLKANGTMEAELKDQDVLHRHAKQTLRVLDQHLKDPNFRSSAHELLRQVLVMSWGAFEILVNDTLRLLMNERPDLIKAFAESKLHRELLSSRTLLDALEGNGFNLSSVMGDVVCNLMKLDSLEKIRDAIRLSLADSSVDAMLKDERLWRLSQQRHLIVHRRGLVDARYLDRTGDDATIGEHINFDANYVEESLAMVRDAGCAVFNSALKRLTKT